MEMLAACHTLLHDIGSCQRHEESYSENPEEVGVKAENLFIVYR